jgi:hypothetical protein
MAATTPNVPLSSRAGCIPIGAAPVRKRCRIYAHDITSLAVEMAAISPNVPLSNRAAWIPIRAAPVNVRGSADPATDGAGRGVSAPHDFGVMGHRWTPMNANKKHVS